MRNSFFSFFRLIAADHVKQTFDLQFKNNFYLLTLVLYSVAPNLY